MKLFKGKKWIVAGIGAILVITAAAAAVMNSGISVDNAAADRGEVTKLLKETGTAESSSTIIVTAKNSGDIRGLAVEEGDRVMAGDLLMTSGGTSAALDIKSQRAELTGLQVQYSQARELADKNKALYEQGAMSYQDYNASDTAAKQLAAQISALQYAIESYAESSGAEGIIAPIDGVITGIFIKEGESVSPGAPLFEISNLNDIYVKADFIAEDADLIHEGDKVTILNKDAGFLDESGSVRKIYLKAENKMSDLGVNQKRVTVEISFGTAERVRLGSNMDVEIAVEKKENVLRVSDLAVFEMNKSDFVYVIDAGKAALRQVETGLEGEDHIEILSGLSAGDIVIVSPGDDVSDGVRIKL